MIGYRALAAGAAFLLTTGAAAAASIDGEWLSQTHHGVVQLYDCGGEICGRVVTSDLVKDHPDLRDTRNKDASLQGRPIKGLTILKGFVGGPDEWKGGAVYDPEDGNTYHGSIRRVDANTVKLTGCVVFPLCRTQTWTRVQ